MRPTLRILLLPLLLSGSTLITSSKQLVSCQQVQPTRDEFNSTEELPSSELAANLEDKQQAVVEFPSAIRRVLLRYNYSDCCPSWEFLTNNHSEVVEELNSIARRQKSSRWSLKPRHLLQEYRRTFLNITYLSIEGQSAGSERDRYYKFLDQVQYFLRLSKLSREFVVSEASSPNQDVELIRDFNRQLKSVEFRVKSEPTLSSFLDEFIRDQREPPECANSSELELGPSKNTSACQLTISMNPNFFYYEDFLTKTSFGNYYAHNISTIKQAMLAAERIHAYLADSEALLPSNLTRPSKQYQVVQRLSSELYRIRKELEEKIDLRIRSNRLDVRSLFAKISQLEESKPYIKMLGDVYEPQNDFGHCVRKLTDMLGSYLNNNMTGVTFYQELTELPEEFIVLGANIANDYETREVPPLLQIQQQHQQQPPPYLDRGGKTSGGKNNLGWIGMIRSSLFKRTT